MGRKKNSKDKVKRKRKTEINFEKKLYKIGDMTRLLGITSRTVRYYEQMGLLPHVKRTDGNVRLFSTEDVNIIKRIKKLQEEYYYPLEVIKDMIFGKKPEAPLANKIAIVTDSSAGFDKETAKKLKIKIIPLKIKMPPSVKLSVAEKVNLTSLWPKKDQDIKFIPQVVAPSIDEFVEFYLGLHKKGFHEIHSIHLSSALSDTYKNALVAANHVESKIKVTVSDTKTLGGGVYLLAKTLAEAIQKGSSPKEIEVLLAKNCPLLYNMVITNSLKYIITIKNFTDDIDKNRRNIFNGLVAFKPLMLFNQKGDLEIVDCYKDVQEGVDFLSALLNKELMNRGHYLKQAIIYYDYLYTEAVELANKLSKEYKNAEIILEKSNAVISSYIGPESLGVAIL
jgi:DegV family protein with EDD domain